MKKALLASLAALALAAYGSYLIAKDLDAVGIEHSERMRRAGRGG